MNKIILAGCVITDGGAILLLKRKRTGWYELPGGKMEENEGLAETAVREVYEELKVNVDLKKKLGTTEFNHDSKEYEYHWFLAEIQPNQTLQIGEPEVHARFDFLTIEDSKNYKLSPNTENLIKAIEDNTISLI